MFLIKSSPKLTFTKRKKKKKKEKKERKKERNCLIQRQKAPPPPAAGESKSCIAMASSRHCLYLSILFVLIAFTHSYTPFLSYEVLKAGRSNRRSLFEGEEITECPINMQKQNYTIITSKCKRPGYPASLCCEALLEFCCGFVDEVNDMSTNCAEMMFYYINRYGKYPVGLFFNKCKEGPEGLSCQKVLQAQA